MCDMIYHESQVLYIDKKEDKEEEENKNERSE
jgi:hypothetical protein